MAEIDRVNGVIDAFFDASGQEDVNELVQAIERTLMTAKMRSYEVEASEGRYYLSKMENKEFVEHVEGLEENLKSLAANLPKTRNEMKQAFRDITFRAMAAKRATYPLHHPECPSISRSPEEALLDDDDAYSFAIFDTQAEAIQELAPPLYQLACEADGYDEGGEDAS